MGYFKSVLKKVDAQLTHVIAREINVLSQRLSKVENEVYNRSTRLKCDYNTSKKAVEELQRRLDVDYKHEVYYLLVYKGKYLSKSTIHGGPQCELVSYPSLATRFKTYADAFMESDGNYVIRKVTVISENILDEKHSQSTRPAE